MKKKHLSRKFLEWRAVTMFHIDKLNEGHELGLNIPYYSLGYRGKNHRLVLEKDGDAIVAGMIHITKTLITLRKLKHYYEGLEDEKDNNSI